jgi:hypothetical protein
MASRRLEDDFSDDEVPQYTERVTFNDQWVATWTPELAESYFQNGAEAEQELMSLVLAHRDDPNPIKIAGRELPPYNWTARVFWNGVFIDRIPLADAIDAVSGNVPDWVEQIMDRNNIPREAYGIVTLAYKREKIHEQEHDSTPGLETSNAANAVAGYLMQLVRPSPVDEITYVDETFQD